MGFFEDIEEALDNLIDELDEEAGATDKTISVEIVKGKEDLDKRVKELENDGFTVVGVQKKTVRSDDDADDEEEEDLPEDEEDYDFLRTKARQQFKEMVEEKGLDKAIVDLDRSMYRGIIDHLLSRGLPLDPDAVAEYNRLALELNEDCDPDTLEFLYMLVHHSSVKLRKEIYDGRFA